MSDFRDIEITDFTGQQTNVNKPERNSAQVIENFDLRSKLGVMSVREGYSVKYELPSHSRLSNIENLSFSNFYVPDWDDGREVTVLIQKAVLNPEAGSLATAIETIAIWVRPFFKVLAKGIITNGTTSTVTTSIAATENQYVGKHLIFFSAGDYSYQSKIVSHTTGANAVFTCENFPVIPSGEFEIMGWADEWEWINEALTTSISNITGYGDPVNHYMSIDVPLVEETENLLSKWYLYNYNRADDTGVLASSPVGQGLTQLVPAKDAQWQFGDIVYLTKNFLAQPWKIVRMAKVLPEEISFHNILNEIRINFGSSADRIAASICFRQKSLKIGSYFHTMGSIAYMPKPNLLSNIFGLTLDPYNTSTVPGTYTPSFLSYGTGNWPNKKYFYYILVILDGFNKFLVAQGDFTTSALSKLRIELKWLFGTFNKRITSIAVYASENLPSSTSAVEPYYLLMTENISGEYTSANQLNQAGFIYFLNDDVPYSVFTLNKSKNLELYDDLGYYPTLVYASSWDMAIKSGGKVVVFNPYIGSEKLKNKIIYSRISGVSTFMYDVIPAQDYRDFETNDGNDVVGIEVLSNTNFIVLRENGYQIIDTDSGIPVKTVYGKGCISRKSIYNFGDHVAWCGSSDIYMADSNSDFILSEKTIRDSYNILTLPQKQSIFAIRDEKETYRFFSGNTQSKVEYLFNKQGFVSAIRNDYPRCYSILSDGSVCFLTSNKIMHPIESHNDNNAGIAAKWRSNPIDIDQLPEISSSGRMIIGALLISYNSTTNFTLSLYLDGKQSTHKVITLPAVTKKTSRRLQVLGATCKSFELEIMGNVNNNNIEIYLVGVAIKVMKIGKW